MVDQVGFNPNLNSGVSLAGNNIVPANKNLFNNGLFSSSANNYDNDFLMSGMNFGQTPSVQTDTFQTQQGVSQTTFTSNPVETKEPEKIPVQENEQKEVQEVKCSNIAKIVGASTGFLAPIGGKLFELCKGGEFKELFKFKPLAITCTVLGVVGYGIGMLVDSLLDAKKAQTT